MNKCPHCQTSFKPWRNNKVLAPGAPGLNEDLMVPACACFKDRADDSYNKHLQEESRARAEARFKNLGFNNHEVSPTVQVPHEGWDKNYRALIEEGSKFIFYGPTGTLKTEIIKVMGHRLCVAGYRVRGGYLQWILDSLKDMDQVEERMHSLLTGNVLILDDLDKPTMTKYEVDRLMSMVNHYDTPGRTILVTMNIDLPTLGQKMARYGSGDEILQKAEAIISRLQNRAVIVHQNDKSVDRRMVSEAHGG